MYQYSTKDFKLLKIIDNKYYNNKGYKINENIAIIYGSQNKESYTYLINRQNCTILDGINFEGIILGIASKNDNLYIYFEEFNYELGYRYILKKYKINNKFIIRIDEYVNYFDQLIKINKNIIGYTDSLYKEKKKKVYIQHSFIDY